MIAKVLDWPEAGAIKSVRLNSYCLVNSCMDMRVTTSPHNQLP